MKWNHEFKLIENDKTFRVYESENKRARIDFFDGMIRVAIYDTNSYIFPTFSICPPNFIMPRNGRDRLDTSFLDTIEINNDIKIDDIDIKINTNNFILSYYKKNELLFKDRDIMAYNLNGELGSGSYHYLSRRDNEKIFGLGDKTGDINKTKKHFRMETFDAMGFNANSSDPLYKQIPFYICVNDVGSYGIYYDTYSNGEFDFGCEINNYYENYKYAHFDEDSLVYYVIFGTPKEILHKFIKLTGKAILPPKWAFRYTASTMEYTDSINTEEKLNEFLKLLKKYKIDCGGFYLSSGYTSINDKRYVFNWNKDKIKNPKALSLRFTKKGINFLPNVKPAFLITHPLYEKIKEKGWFLHYKNGDPAVFPFWGGYASYLDFTNVDAYDFWTDCVKKNLIDKGFESIWNDNNEYDIHDDDVYANGFGHEIKAKLIRPLFSLLMSNASFDASKKDHRIMNVSRSGAASLERVSWTWTGDNYTSFSDFRGNHKMAMSLALSGFRLFGQDIGGFYGPTPSKELFIRWIQYGIFTPRFTLHSWKEGMPSTMPWLYDDIMPTIKKLFNFRKMLIPYLYSEANRAIEEYDSLISPLFLDYPSYDIESDYFMVGKNILSCPVFDEGVKYINVSLPSNTNWYYKDKLYSGTIKVKAPLNDLPTYFIKEGSIVPLDENGIIFNIYPLKTGNFEYKYYNDESLDNKYIKIDVECLESEVIASGIDGEFRLHDELNRKLIIK